MKKVILRGPILSRSGYGEHTRFFFRALYSFPELYDVYVLPTGWGQSNWTHESTEENKAIMSCIHKTNETQLANPAAFFDISLQVLIPPEWQSIAKYNIGVTAAVETNKASGAWVESCNKMDRIFVTSEHAKNSLCSPTYTLVDEHNNPRGELSCTTPVDVISYPFRDLKKDTAMYKNLNLETEFNFLTVAQFGPRKNLKNTLQWFLEEFKFNEKVGFVIKAHHMNNSRIDKTNMLNNLKPIVDQFPDRLCKIYLLHGNLKDEEMSALYTHPNIHAYITATHGEGFGLPVFEAACNGLPVAAPAWSGHVDFLYADLPNEVSGKIKRIPMFTKIRYELNNVQQEAVWENVIDADSKWCFPTEESFKRSIRNLYDVYKPSKKVAERLMNHLKENLNQEKMFEIVSNSIKKVLPEDEGELETWLEQFSESVVVND